MRMARRAVALPLMRAFSLAGALHALLSALVCHAYIVPSGSPGFYAGNSTSAVTFDEHSVFLDGKRVFVFSGEMHPWRAPSGGPTWRDVLQKMKVSLYSNDTLQADLTISRLRVSMRFRSTIDGARRPEDKESLISVPGAIKRRYIRSPKRLVSW